jgi:hypothetical protein
MYSPINAIWNEKHLGIFGKIVDGISRKLTLLHNIVRNVSYHKAAFYKYVKYVDVDLKSSQINTRTTNFD